MFQLQRVGSHDSIMPKIKTVKLLRDMRGGGFVARRFNNYNRCKGYGRTSAACQTYAFQEKKYTKKRNQWDSSQEKEEYKERVGASNKNNGGPKEDVRASVPDHVRSVPEVLEVF